MLSNSELFHIIYGHNLSVQIKMNVYQVEIADDLYFSFQDKLEMKRLFHWIYTQSIFDFLDYL
jgi:hypothetical protein